ncbi:MAG: phosphatidate cytidylyltransferase [Saccharofermentans sp.]|nr:phosphatidate cytidylyltransferase [Saccharofermentans sp.]
MRQRVLTGIAFVVGVAVFVLPSIVFPIFMLLFSILVGAVSFYEMTKALKAGGHIPTVPMFILGSAASVAILLISYWRGLDMMTSIACYALIVVMLAFACVVIPSVVRPDGNHLMDGLVTSATLIYITFPLFCLCAVSMLADKGWYYMMPALFAAWISDTMAYFSGVTLGKHKIVPHISPKKTWEGCIGGALGCAIVITLYFDIVIYNVAGITMNIVLFSVLSFFLGFLMSVMSQLGDWLASLIKRRVGIKDYGNIFPGHGGMLDRFDSAFFTIPTGVLLALIAVFFT